MKEFIGKIITTLETNGFPGKKVSLPTEKMYEAADNRGLSFNKVMEVMRNEYNIDSSVESEKIVFSKQVDQQFNEDMFQKAQEMMANMDPAELQKVQETIMNMSDEEREELMKKGRDMGLL